MIFFLFHDVSTLKFLKMVLTKTGVYESKDYWFLTFFSGFFFNLNLFLSSSSSKRWVNFLCPHTCRKLWINDKFRSLQK